MTHEELLAEIDAQIAISYAGSGFSEYAANGTKCEQALRTVIELHNLPKVGGGGGQIARYCRECGFPYPCPTIQAIEKELT